MMDKNQYLTALHQLWTNCRACGLCQDRSKVVFGYGNPDAQIMIIGEAPGENEDRVGLPFVGQAGLLLDQFLGNVSAREDVIQTLQTLLSLKGGSVAADQQRNEHRIRLRELLLQEFYFTNIVMCRPPENRDPNPKEVEACRVRLFEQIYTIDPVLIIVAGRVAAEALIGKKISITQARGEIFDVEFTGRSTKYVYPVMAVLHPAYLLRTNDFNTKGDSQGKKTYNDFLHAMKIVDEFNLHHYGIDLPKARPKFER
jgi:uracil-DNA glycosylase family 4